MRKNLVSFPADVLYNDRCVASKREKCAVPFNFELLVCYYSPHLSSTPLLPFYALVTPDTAGVKIIHGIFTRLKARGVHRGQEKGLGGGG